MDHETLQATGSIDYPSLKHNFAPRPRNAHKGDFGHVLIVGGYQGYGGAALMAAEAAARVGAGLVSVATHPSHVAAFLAHRPELMVRGFDNHDELNPLIEKASVIVIGPGLGQADWSILSLQKVAAAQSERPVPLVVDADALNLISAGKLEDLTGYPRQWILTPHPGEAARLLNLDTADVQSDRNSAACRLQSTYGGVAILKGAGSLVCYQNGSRQHLDKCTHGNPGMASGGMGDILSGILGGLLAQHFPLHEAARLGVCLHGQSADLASADGERGMLATDLLPYLRGLVNP